jgi:hypothetical protein
VACIDVFCVGRCCIRLSDDGDLLPKHVVGSKFMYDLCCIMCVCWRT